MDFNVDFEEVGKSLKVGINLATIKEQVRLYNEYVEKVIELPIDFILDEGLLSKIELIEEITFVDDIFVNEVLRTPKDKFTDNFRKVYSYVTSKDLIGGEDVNRVLLGGYDGLYQLTELLSASIKTLVDCYCFSTVTTVPYTEIVKYMNIKTFEEEK